MKKDSLDIRIENVGKRLIREQGACESQKNTLKTGVCVTRKDNGVKIALKRKLRSRSDEEYQLCKSIATYMKLQYPKVFYHFDLAGLNLSKVQAGKQKAIQLGRGFPDLFIAEPRGIYHGLFIELKKEGEKLMRQNGNYATPHILEQEICMSNLRQRGYESWFAIGFDSTKIIIDRYLKYK